eukprot:m.471992 g.471992  ORF g.471992 m.471992 type:complete len:467 (-) comp31984_c0_seq1:135-1535(-)
MVCKACVAVVLVTTTGVGPAVLRPAQADPSPSQQLHLFGPPPPELVSRWEPLSDQELPRYFLPSEIKGLQTGNCGPLRGPHAPTDRRQAFLGGIRSHPWDNGTIGHEAGPCCPNGQYYGNNRLPNMKNSRILRSVEILNGKRTPPFQAHEVVKALRQNSPDRTRYSLWFSGDSVMQLTWISFLCAFVRAGATVQLCELSVQPHRFHPLCNATKRLPGRVLSRSSVRGWHPKRAEQSYNAIDQAAIVNIDGVEVRLFMLCEFTGVEEPQQRCLKSLVDLINQSGVPDVLLMNAGLHSHSREHLERALDAASQAPLALLDRTVWVETSVSHFPFSNRTGLYKYYVQRVHQQWTGEWRSKDEICESVSNFDEVYKHSVSWPEGRVPAWCWRQIVNQWWLQKNTRIPVLQMRYAELGLGDGYAGFLPPKSASDLPIADCVHRLYAPLYYDAMLSRLAQIVRKRTETLLTA